ncbi:hypothetical protein [Sneathiella chinensis]|uniref:Uncharacterized protein n=1 Tax=Sneathiella chinensis TaxID=349750 RepID=A0ABQ5U8L3_9PROT|nr:hypothetical protein [Sneathiella chinensis]GLQ07599.1 hypothetical protein GCM10007924_28200 [Sneathiella chinensis]
MTKVLADAGLLSLSALPLQAGADAALPAGTHLRWHLSPELGFPHAGFRVRRRPAPTWPWKKSEAFRALITRHNVATSAAGVHLSNHPLRIEQATVTSDFGLRSEQGRPMRFVYEQREREDPVFQPWVRFAVILEGGSKALAAMVRMRGFTRRGDSTVEVASVRKSFRRLAPVVYRGALRRAIFISAAELQSVSLQIGRGLVVREILYCTADHLHQQRDWEDLAILPPLCREGTADVVAPDDLRQMAFERLRNMRPLKRPADPAAPGTGRSLSMRDHMLFEKAVLRQAEKLADSQTKAFRQEIEERIPPGQILLNDVEAEPLRNEDGREGEIGFPFYGLLQAGAFESHISALLGLGYRDEDSAEGGVWDYGVDAVVSSMWLYISQLTPAMREAMNLVRLPPQLVAHGPNAKVWGAVPKGFRRVFACALDQKAGRPASVPVPGVRAQAIDDPTGNPVQAAVAVTVLPNSHAVRPLLWRKDGRAVHPLSPTDPVSGLLVPTLQNGQLHLSARDASLTDYGNKRYQAANMDIFGRASAIATTTCRVEDEVPPPAPASLELVLGDPSAGNEKHFPKAQSRFRWTNAMAAAAPDLRYLHIYWRSGYAEAEEIMAARDGHLRIDWPLPQGQRVERDAEGLTLINDLPLDTARDGYRRQVSALCLAEDQAGNLSVPSQAVQAILVDEIKPTPPKQPDDVQWSTWPDAVGEVRWRCRWTLPDGASAARISSASETRLLNLAGVDKQTHYRLPDADRAEALKQLAITLPQAFVPEALGYPETVTWHDVVMKAGSRDFRVVVTEFIGATGQKAPWPDSPEYFSVIRARSLEPLPVPSLTVDMTNRQASILPASNGRGTVEIYAIHSPADIARIPFQAPIGTMEVSQLSSLSHQPAPNPDPDPNAAPRWVGYLARLAHPDGRHSDYSPPVWREIR